MYLIHFQPPLIPYSASLCPTFRLHQNRLAGGEKKEVTIAQLTTWILGDVEQNTAGYSRILFLEVYSKLKKISLLT